MNIEVQHEGTLSELESRFAVFGRLRQAHIEPHAHRHWKRNPGGESHDLQVAVLGKSGYGKSSLVNALVGGDFLRTSDVAACTRTAQCVDYRIRTGNHLSFADLPGLGESAARDEEYLPLYGRMLAKTDLTLYVLRADSRDLTIDERAFARLFPSASQRARMILVLIACDKAAPLQRSGGLPSAAQLRTIEARLSELRRLFPDVADIVPISARSGWNLDHLAEVLVGQLLLRLGKPAGSPAERAASGGLLGMARAMCLAQTGPVNAAVQRPLRRDARLP